MQAQLLRLGNDQKSIQHASKIISLAFSNDPLITWLRPGAQPWGELDNGSMRWQRRRLERWNSENTLLYLQSTRPSAESLGKSPAELTSTELSVGDVPSRFAAVALLEPPTAHRKRTWRQLLLRLKVRLQDTFNAREDPGGNEKRVQMMMEAHEKGMSDVRQMIWPREPWYLEVVAVDPSLQGQGLGGKMIGAILEMVDGDAVVLECTDLSNVGFYKKFGFEEVRTIVLQDDSAAPWSISYCLMMRR